MVRQEITVVRDQETEATHFMMTRNKKRGTRMK